MKCFFCEGNLDMGYCMMCGRSDDIKHELMVKEAQKKEHHNWHGNNPPMWKRHTWKDDLLRGGER